MVDAEGNIAAGPLSYTMSDDGRYIYVKAFYADNSGREDSAPDILMLFTCEPDAATDEVTVVNTEVFDRATRTYTRRIGFDEADYTMIGFDSTTRLRPEAEDLLPGFADWSTTGGYIPIFSIPRGWRLRYFDDQLSGMPLYATLQITDVQQNTHGTPPLRINNPNLHNVTLSPNVFSGDGYEIEMYAVLDTSTLEPGLLIGAQFTNTSDEALAIEVKALFANGHRAITFNNGLMMDIISIEPGETRYEISHLDPACLAGLGELTDLRFTVLAAPKDVFYKDGTPFRCEVSGCDVSAFDPLLEPTLAEATAEGMRGRLVSLERNRTGGLDGLLHRVHDAGGNPFC